MPCGSRFIRNWRWPRRLTYNDHSTGDDHLPKAVYFAYGYVKKAAAFVNGAAGKLPFDHASICARCRRPL